MEKMPLATPETPLQLSDLICSFPSKHLSPLYIAKCSICPPSTLFSDQILLHVYLPCHSPIPHHQNQRPFSSISFTGLQLNETAMAQPKLLLQLGFTHSPQHQTDTTNL